MAVPGYSFCFYATATPWSACRLLRLCDRICLAVGLGGVGVAFLGMDLTVEGSGKSFRGLGWWGEVWQRMQRLVLWGD